MTWIEKAQPFLLLVSIGVGILLAQGMGVAELAADTIAPLLALMLYTTFLPISFKNFGQTLQNTKVVLTSLAINFVWTPLFAWALGAIFLQQSPDLRVGLILLMVTPCTDWYLVFTGMAKGAEFACLSCTTLARNSPLSLAIAASAFPNRPLITVTLAIAPLIELPILVLISRMLLHFRRQKQFPE
jgi:ACR3 family arsenite efflux pump ArsB